MILEYDMSGAPVGESLDIGVLAGGQKRIEARAVQVVFDHEGAVQPMLPMHSPEHDTALVPFPHGVERLGVPRRNHVVQRPGPMGRQFRVGMPLVVQHLIFESKRGVPRHMRRGQFLGDVILDPAVRPFGHFPFESEREIPERVRGHQVAAHKRLTVRSDRNVP